jgi:MFS family permease
MAVKLGLKENWKQFTLLVIVNGFVGGMVGLERTILPQIAETDLGVVGKTAILSFIAVFGITKAITNYYTGAFANAVGRRKLLIAGWLIGLPIPILLIYATSWEWVIAANVLLGINQGLTWSSTVMMKIDLVGNRDRGLAMGINESIGYLAVGIAAFLTGWIASEYGLRPYPFYLGIAFSLIGLLMSSFLIRDTIQYVDLETQSSSISKLKNVFLESTWLHPNLGSISQAGLVNNLNDAMIWGLLPILLGKRGFNMVEISELVAIYPIVWGLGQLLTGRLADILEKKKMLFFGMLLQGVVILGMIFATSFEQFAILGILLGVGTAIVYPTFLSAIAENTNPEQRAKSIGIFRLWRDLGYAIGAILTGLIADIYDVEAPVIFIGVITLISAAIIQVRMKQV